MLCLHPWLIGLYGLPRTVVLVIGVANLCYAAGSFSLARRATRPRSLVAALAVANLGWSVVCVGLAAAFAESATLLGTAVLLGEALFVGVLGSLEWRLRDRLSARREATLAGILSA